MFRALRSHKLYVPLITVAGSVGLFFIYYFFYVSSQRSYANDRAFRLLAVVGDQLAKKFYNLGHVFAAGLASGHAEDYLKTEIPGLQNKISGIKVTPGCPTLTNREGSLDLSLAPKPGNIFLRAEFHPAEAPLCSVSAEVDFNANVREHFSNTTEEYFDDMLIASSSGEVLFQKNVSGLRITNLNALLSPKAWENKPPKQGETPAKTGEPAIAFQDASEFSDVIDVKLAGTDYKLYVQPVPVAMQGPQHQNLKLIVCGLWRSDRLQSEVVSIPYSVLIWGTLIVLSVFALVWPLLKVAYMSPSERLRRRHVLYLLFSSLFATTMLTVVVLNWAYSLRADEESGEQLEALAERIDGNVKAELVRALAFLDTFGKSDQLHTGFRAMTSSEEFLKSNFFSPGGQKDEPYYYPYFKTAFWFDRDGRQQYKIAVKAKATPPTRVPDEIRLAVESGQLLKVEESGTRFHFDQRYSPNTGEFVIVLATKYTKPVGWTDLPQAAQNLIGQALITQFLSLFHPVVPEGFGYAVVDHEGIVQFHSSPARNQIEDFLKECRNDAALTSLVTNGEAGHLKVNYMGKAQEMLVRPMPYLAKPAASLIVFRDCNYFTTVNVACILVFALLPGLLGLFGLPLLVALAYFLFWRWDYPLERLWPAAEDLPKYVDVLAANACLAAAFAIRFSAMKANEILVALLAITAVSLFLGMSTRRATGNQALPYKAPVLAAILVVARWDVALLAAGVYMALSYPRVSETINAFAKQYAGVKRLYLGMVLSLLAVLVVLPCFGLFKISYNTVNRLALESAQLARRDQLIHRAERAQEYFQDLKEDQKDLKADEFACTRIKERLDRYDDPIFYPKDAPKEPKLSKLRDHRSDRDVSWLQPLIAQASGWFPSNRLGAEMRARAMSQADDGAEWKVAEDGDDALLWLIPSAAAGGEAAACKEAAREELLGVYPLWQLPLPAFGLMLLLAAVLAVWLSYVIRKVFLTDLEDVPQPDKWVPAGVGRRDLLIVGHPMSGKASRAAALPDVDLLDLAQVVTTGSWILPALRHPTVVVDHFEFDLDNPNTCLAKLKLLEQLHYVEKKKVILLSAVDPMFYLAASSPEIVTPTSGDPQPPAQILDRWAAVLTPYEKLGMEDITAEYFTRFLAEQDRPCRPELAAMVVSECDHTAQLRKIGLTMLETHCSEEPMSKAQCVEELLDRADSYYRTLWSCCTKQERLVLFQLAQDGWANPKNERAIQQLQRRRIIRRHLGFRIMNDSFRRFVRTVQTPDEVAKWQDEEEHSTWSAVKLGLSTALMMFGAWLLYAQQDVFQLGIGYLATLGTASGAVVSLARSLTGKGGAGKSGP